MNLIQHQCHLPCDNWWLDEETHNIPMSHQVRLPAEVPLASLVLALPRLITDGTTSLHVRGQVVRLLQERPSRVRRVTGKAGIEVGLRMVILHRWEVLALFICRVMRFFSGTSRKFELRLRCIHVPTHAPMHAPTHAATDSPPSYQGIPYELTKRRSPACPLARLDLTDNNRPSHDGCAAIL